MKLSRKERKQQKLELNRKKELSVLINSKLNDLLVQIKNNDEPYYDIESLRQAVINMSKNVDSLNINVLNTVISSLDEIISNPFTLNVNSELIRELDIRYNFNQEMFNSNTLDDLRKISTTNLRVQQASREILRIENRRNEITETIIKLKLKTTDSRHRSLVNEFNNLKIELEKYQYILNTNQAVIMQNLDSDSLMAKTKTIKEAQTMKTMSTEDFIDSQIHLKQIDNKFIDEFEEREFAKENFGVGIGIEADNTELLQSVELYLSEQLLNKEDEELIEHLAKERPEQIFSKMNELSRKLEDLLLINEIASKEQKDEMNRLYTMQEKIYENGILDNQVGDNLKDQIDHLLKINNPNLVAASSIVRATIENYCRYNGGINLTDTFRFNRGTKIEDKFRAANIKENIISELAVIYRRTNDYIHNDFLKTSLITNEERKEQLIEEVNKLTLWGIDKFDIITAFLNVYNRQDEYFKEVIKDLNSINEFKALNNVYYAVRNQVNYGLKLKEKHINLESEFKDAKNVDEYYVLLEKYLNK